MDQVVIECMKRHYRRQLLRKPLIADEDEEGTVAVSYTHLDVYKRQVLEQVSSSEYFGYILQNLFIQNHVQST